MTQTAIPVEEAPPEPQACAWCGKPAHDTIEVEPARWRNDRGTRVVAKPARIVPVCAKHYKSLVRTRG